MFNISSIYQKRESYRFDFDYYLKVHMPMSISKLSSAKGYRGVSVERGISIEQPPMESAYVAMCHYYFETLEDFMAAFLPHAETLQGDIPNYTDITPVIQINEVEIAEHKGPTYGNGKICYVEIPATDVSRSASFYEKTFGWNVRTRGDGATAFDDGVGEVSGAFVKGRPPSQDPGLLLYIMVEDAAKTVESVIANGAQITQPIGADAPEITARFRDPGGNVIGIYQERALETK